MACVVLTGIPNHAMIVKITPPPGYPPKKVPIANAVAAERITQTGTSKLVVSKNPPAISKAVITPIVFCPSFAPCVREKKAADAICNLPKTRFILSGCDLKNILIIFQMPRQR